MGLRIVREGGLPIRVWDKEAMGELASGLLDVIDDRTFVEGIGSNGRAIPKPPGRDSYLVRSGLMRASMRTSRVQDTKARIEVGRAAWYGKIVDGLHPFMGLAASDAELVNEALGDALIGAAARSRDDR